MAARRQSSFQLLIICAVIALLGAFTQGVRQPAADGLFRLTVLDVGQGDALLLDTPHGEHVLVDAGPSGEDVLGVIGRYLVRPTKLRLLVASHNHADHIGGLPAVLSEYGAEEVWISGAVHTTDVYLRWLQAIQASGAPTKAVKAGETITIDGVTLTVLYPLTSLQGERLDHEHDGTVVMKASYGAVSVLLTGDLEDEHEAALLAEDPAALGATILKVTHHGSKYASTEELLRAVHPAVAVISVGADNKFGHPAQETLDRLAAQRIPVFRTDQQGTVQLTSDGAQLWVEPERGERQRVDIFSGGR